jgi:hypothetical protein
MCVTIRQNGKIVVNPIPKTSFHVMVMLNDAHTGVLSRPRPVRRARRDVVHTIVDSRVWGASAQAG